MTDKINVDSDLQGSDWIKTISWGFPEVVSLEDLFYLLGVSQASDEEKRSAIYKFLKLPYSVPMPDDLRKAIYEFLGEKLPNQNFINRISWCIQAVSEFFPEDREKITAVYKNIKESNAQFLDDLSFEDQMVIIDLETREIPEDWYPKSQLQRDIYIASKLRKQ